MKYLALISFLSLMLIGCPSTTPPLAPSIQVSQQASNWSLLYGSGTPSHPTSLATGWEFAFPVGSGSVNYVTVPFEAAHPILGRTLVATFVVESTNAVYVPANGTDGPPSMHLYMQRQGDNLSAQGVYQYYRWWCANGYDLGAKDNQVVAISCPLVSTSWTSVYGQQDAAEFAAALSNLAYVGVTFGGSDGYGHGVYLAQGSATFTMLSYDAK